MDIRADFNFIRPPSTGLFKKSKKWHIHLTDYKMDVALESVKTFAQSPKPTWKEKITGKRYAVLKVTDGDNSVFVKVNKKSLMKNLYYPMNFNDEYKKNRDMTKYVKDFKETMLRKENIEFYKKNFTAFARAPDETKKDRELGLALVKFYPSFLEHLDSTLKNDKELVIEAIKRDPMVLKFASKHLKNDKEVVMLAIENNPKSYKYASKTMQDDPEVNALYHTRSRGYGGRS